MIAKFKENAEYLVLYSNKHYTDCSHPTIYELDQIDLLCKRIELKYKTLREYICKGLRLPNGMELFKQTKDDKFTKII
jgi:hypothetical protein